MANIGINRILVHILNKWQPLIQTKRFRYWEDIRKTRLVRRHGYKDEYFPNGMLPRINDGKRIKELPIYRPKDSWSVKKASFGQNDYIDILGNGKLHPARIAYNVPSWLKTFRGNEYTMLLRKTKMLDRGIFPLIHPTKWSKMKSRIDWLWYHLNYRRKIY